MKVTSFCIFCILSLFSFVKFILTLSNKKVKSRFRIIAGNIWKVWKLVPLIQYQLGTAINSRVISQGCQYKIHLSGGFVAIF